MKMTRMKMKMEKEMKKMNEAENQKNSLFFLYNILN